MAEMTVGEELLRRVWGDEVYESCRASARAIFEDPDKIDLVRHTIIRTAYREDSEMMIEKYGLADLSEMVVAHQSGWRKCVAEHEGK
jgi:phenylalanine-4-hydroxylase